MQPEQPLTQQAHAPEQVLKDLKVMNHFSFQIPLPETASIFAYTPKHHSESKKKKKIKHKFESFTYYQLPESKVKILFINDESFIDQGEYPFTDPSGKERKFSEINGKRLKITEAAYIGHVNDDLIIKKMEGVTLGQDGLEVETVDDKFEVIKLSNPQRFSQFLKVMSLNKNSIQLSIRVIIDETNGKKPEVIDFEFFFREKQLTEKHRLVSN